MLQFLQWFFNMLFLFVLFVTPYYVLVRRFFSRASKIEAFLYSFVLSSFMKLVFFAFSVIGPINIRYSLLFETSIFVIISMYLAYRGEMWRDFKGNTKKVGIFIACFFLVSCVVYRFSFRYDWDSNEVYLAYARDYYEKDRLIGFSPEISNYLSVPPLTSIIYAWIFCMTGLNDLNTFFLPVAVFMASVLGIYAISRKHLRIDKKLVLFVTAINPAILASLIAAPRYADILFSMLCIVFLILLLNQENVPNYKMAILLILTLATAIYCKVFAFALYFLILILIVPRLRFSHNKFKYVILPLIWAPFIYVSTFVTTVSNITVPGGTLTSFQIGVVIFLSLLSVAYFFIVKGHTTNIQGTTGKKTRLSYFTSMFILLILLSLPYFYYEYSLSGTIFFPYVKGPAMSASQDLVLQTSKEFGRVESTPISVLYLFGSPGIWIFLPFFFFAVFSSAHRILNNKTRKKDLFTFQILAFSLLFLLMDYSVHVAVRTRHQILFFVLYQIICISGFSELLGKLGCARASIKSWAFVYATLFSVDTLFNFTRIHPDLPSYVSFSFLPTFGMEIAIAIALISFLVLNSKLPQGIDREIPVGWIRKISASLRRHFVKVGCLAILFISLLASTPSIVTYWESSFGYIYSFEQVQMMEALQSLPTGKVFTFCAVGEYYYGMHPSFDICNTESLSLIYPAYTQNLTVFINKLVDLNITYVLLPSDKNYYWPWFESFVKRIPVLNIFKSSILFPLVQHLDKACFDIKFFNMTALPKFLVTPQLLDAKAVGEFTVSNLVGDKPLDHWLYVGRSQTVTFSFTIFLPKGYDLMDISVDANAVFYFQNDTVIRQNIILECTTQKDLEHLFTITTNITGVDVEGLHWYTVQIPKVTLNLSCENSNKCSLVLVSNIEKPLTIWYTPSTNEWSLEEGTYPFCELFVKK